MSLREANEAFEAVIGLLPEAVLLVSSEGRVLSGNAEAAQMLGRSVDELRARPLEDLIQEDRARLAEFLRVGSRSRSLVPGRLTFSDRDGGAIPCRCSIGALQPRRGATPALLYLRLAPTDKAAERFIALNSRIDELSREIHRRRRAEATVGEQRAWLQVTLASIGDAVIATDRSGRVVLMNAVAELLTGWRGHDAYGRPLDEVFVISDEASGERMDTPVARVLREGTVVGLANHTILVSRRGARVPIDDSAAPIRDADGQIHGVVLVFRDVAERRALERERMQADRRKDEFLAMLGHELRNPLAVLGNGIQVLRLAQENRDGLRPDEDLGRIVASMERQVRQLARLVDDLLDVSRITRGTIALRREHTPLDQVVRVAIEGLRPALAERGIDLHVALAKEPLLVDGDPDRLAQVVDNLLSNAIKFSPVGARVWLSGTAEADTAEVRVRDEGSGIAPDMLESIFDLFTQADSTLGRSEGGLGVGLTVARQIVEQHGGSIAAYSEGRGRGSEFVVRIPLAARSAVSPSEGRSSPRAGEPRRILIVDDNADAANSLAMLLELSGHDVRTAYDGPAALKVAQEHRPDTVLLDVGMPGMDGYEVARRLRDEVATRNVAIIAITGYGGDVHRERAEAAGFDHHLLKPVDLAALERLFGDR